MKKYDLTAAPCLWLANHSDWSRWLLFVVSHLFVVPVLVLLVGLKKRVNDRIYLQGHILNTIGGALTSPICPIHHTYLPTLYYSSTLPASNYVLFWNVEICKKKLKEKAFAKRVFRNILKCSFATWNLQNWLIIHEASVKGCPCTIVHCSAKI